MRLSLLVALSVLFSGCASREVALSELTNLPISTGAHVRPRPLPVGWVYRGSDTQFHYIDYKYTMGNVNRSKYLRIQKDEMEIPFEVDRTDGSHVKFAIIPTRIGARIIGFKKVKSSECAKLSGQ